MVFFFFQAEDGIRYLTVTGVQTCALPISSLFGKGVSSSSMPGVFNTAANAGSFFTVLISEKPSSRALRDRKSTRLNSSHSQISYAVFCLKKKKKQKTHAAHSKNKHTCGQT